MAIVRLSTSTGYWQHNVKRHHKIPVAGESSCLDCEVRQFAWFEPGDESHLRDRQALRSGQYRVRAGAKLFAEGEALKYAFTLKKGWAIYEKLLKNGRRQVLHVALPGDFIGCQANFEEPIDYSVTAGTECVVCAFSPDNLQHLLESDPNLMRRLFRINADKSKKCRTQVASLGQVQAKQRFALFLSELVERLAQRGVDPHGPIDIPLSREDIADAIGITSIHLSRVATELLKDGIVECRHNRLQVQDIDELRKLAAETL